MVATIPLPNLGYTFQSGNVTVSGIQDVDGNGGALTVKGCDGATFNGSGAGVFGGDSNTANGGDAVLQGGASQAAAGGNVTVAGGASFDLSSGGTVNISGGHSFGTGQTGGDIFITPGAGDTQGFVMIDSLIIRLPSVPTADPHVANALYTAGAPSAGVPKPLMVSGG